MKKSGKIFFLSVCCAAVAAAGLALTACGDKGDATAGLKPTEGLRYIPAPDEGEGYWVSGMGAAEVSELVIPSTYLDEPVTGVASSAFSDNKNLMKIVIPKSVKTIGAAAFEYSGLLEVAFSEGLEEIGQDAFVGCKMNKIDLPESLKTIGESAFSYCRFLKEVNLPVKLEFLEEFSFSHSGLEIITVDEGNEKYYSENNCQIERETKTLIQGGAKSKIPDDVVAVGDFAFMGIAIESLTLPDSVVSLGQQAFSGCNSLTAVTIPKQISSIEWGAFYQCENLETVTLEEGMTFTGEYMFSGCGNLASLNLPSTLKTIGESSFADCLDLETVTIPDSAETIGDHAFFGCYDLTNVKIGKNVKTICDYAFSKCSSLETITIPDSVETIGEGGFWYCEKLVNVKLGKNLKSIGGSAFKECFSLKKLVIPKSVEEIVNQAFYSYGDNTVYLFAEVEEGEAAWETSSYTTVYWAGEWEYRNGEPYPLE